MKLSRRLTTMQRLATRSILAMTLMLSAVGCNSVEAADVAPAPNRPIRDKWALVVGISNFENPKLNLRYSSKDASDFANYLTHNAGFAPDHVKILLNKDATQRRILSELGNKWLPHVANPDDLVVIFLSTHGSGSEMDIGGQNYLIAYDTDIDDLYTSAIPMQRLAHDIKSRVHCDRVIIFLDACHSGATENGGKGLIRTGVDAGELSAGSGQLVIASSKEDQISWESKKLANGVFTAVLLDTLKKQGASTTIGQMFDGLKDDVQDTVLRERGTLQTPVMKSEWNGNDVLIAAKPTSPRPGFDDGKADASESPTTVATSVSTTPAPVVKKSTSSSAFPVNRNKVTDKAPAKASARPVGASAGYVPSAVAATDDARTNKPEPINPRILLVPGQSVARMNLGMTTAEILTLLGKPTYSSDDVVTYWTSDRKYFLSVLLKSGLVTEIAFSSPAFKTANSITLSNYASHAKEFSKPTGSTVTLTDGGFSITDRGKDLPVGVIYKKKTVAAAPGWWDAHSNPPAKPAHAATN
ncbi:MAG: caspase family protein [Cyanobacteria bacterium SZAS-4]|nr:caspase family protein [Cyanobacteria bacterium SZAS-4]